MNEQVDHKILKNKVVKERTPDDGISLNGSRSTSMTTTRQLKFDCLKIIRSIISISEEIDEIVGSDEKLTLMKNELEVNMTSLLRVLNEVFGLEKRTILYERDEMTDVEFSQFVLNMLYMKFFNYFVANPNAKAVVYKGVRDNFRIYDIPNYRVRIFMLDDAKVSMATDWALSISGKKKRSGGIVEKERKYREKIMLLSKTGLFFPILLNAIVPKFHSPATIDHMRFLVEKNYHDQVSNVHKDTSLARSTDYDWDAVFDESMNRNSSSTMDSFKGGTEVRDVSKRIGSVGRNLGISFAYSILIPRRSSISLREAIMMNDTKIDKSLGPAILKLFSDMINIDAIVHDFNIDDLCVSIDTSTGNSGKVSKCVLSFVSMKNNPSFNDRKEDDTKKLVSDQIKLFSLLLYTSIMIQTFRLHTVMYVGKSLLSNAREHVPNDPLVAYVHSQSHGNVDLAMQNAELIMRRLHKSHARHLRRVVNLWNDVRSESMSHRNELMRALYPENHENGGLRDVITCIHSQYEDVNMVR